MSVQNSVEFNIDEDFGITEAIATLDNGDFGTRTLRFETGQLARQADGSVTTYLDDDTMLLATTTASNQPREGFDFFPLTVDVEERMYAAGKIPERDALPLRLSWPAASSTARCARPLSRACAMRSRLSSPSCPRIRKSTTTSLPSTALPPLPSCLACPSLVL